MQNLLESLEQEINNETDEKIELILSKARAEAKKIVESATEKAEQIKEEAKKTKEKEGNKIIQKTISNLHIKNKIVIENKKEELISIVFTEVIEKIKKMNKNKDQTYIKLLNDLCLIGILALEEENITIEVDPSDEKYLDLPFIKKQFKTEKNKDCSISVTTKPSDELGGVIIRGESIYVDNRITALIERRKDVWRDEIHKMIFSAED